MRIGLLRHFKVNCPHKKWMTSKEFWEWTQKYEASQVIKNKVEMYGINWDICYSSDLPRAIVTAKEVYSGKVFKSKLLREVVNAPFIHTQRIKLPFELWHVCGRIAWYFRLKSQPESRKDTKRRINEFLDNIDWTKENILLVFHGFLIYNFQKELRKRGFRGEKVKIVRNGVLYLYTREDSQKEVAENEDNVDMCG